ncbi:MAG: hypothetical protein EOL87_07700 [Spartobacteria bacterium]|nr:hypothetical protein [Spartobacteria bacterium]
MNAQKAILIGSTFPLTLIRRHTEIDPMPIDELKRLLRTHPVFSFWGHKNTLTAAHSLLGIDVAPTIERPALQLSAEGYPAFDQHVFTTCYVLSPEYRPGFRPAIGSEVALADILDWRALKLTWN